MGYVNQLESLSVECFQETKFLCALLEVVFVKFSSIKTPGKFTRTLKFLCLKHQKRPHSSLELKLCKSFDLSDKFTFRHLKSLKLNQALEINASNARNIIDLLKTNPLETLGLPNKVLVFHSALTQAVPLNKTLKRLTFYPFKQVQDYFALHFSLQPEALVSVAAAFKSSNIQKFKWNFSLHFPRRFQKPNKPKRLWRFGSCF